MARWKRVVAVAVVAAVAAGVGVIVSRGGDPLRDPRGPGEAAVYAESVLSRVTLPRTALPYSGPLPQGVRDHSSGPAGDILVRRHRVYRIKERPATFLSDLRVRGVEGFNLDGYGETSVGGAPTTLAELLYEQVRPSAGVYSSMLRVAGSDPGVRPSLLRIDVEVTLQPSRTAAEHVSSAYGAVIIDRAVSKVMRSDPPTTEHRVVVDPAAVERLIRLFNALPPTHPHTNTSVYGACEDQTAIAVTFARTANGRPDVAAASYPKCVSETSTLWVFGVTIHAPAPQLLRLSPALRTDSAAARAERAREQPSLTDPDGAFVRAVVEELQR